MRTMHDSTTAADIPADAEMVAGYLNGLYAWSEADWARFPDVPHVSIVIHIPGRTPPNDGDVLDIEATDAPLARPVAARWVADRIAAGVQPAIYTSLSTAHFFAGLPCTFWLADYTTVEHMASVPGLTVVATQYAAPEYGSGGHYDLSLVADDWHATPTTEVKPMFDPALILEPVVASLRCRNGGVWLLAGSGAIYAFECPNHGGANGHDYFAGRTAAQLDPNGDGYTIVASSGERYDYP